MPDHTILAIDASISASHQPLNPLLNACGLANVPLEGQWWLALDGEQLLGGIGLVHLGRGVWLLRSLVVAPEARQQQLGEALVQQATQWALTQNAHALYLITRDAMPYFGRFGWQYVARTELPNEVLACRQLREECPTSAQVMMLSFKAGVMLRHAQLADMNAVVRIYNDAVRDTTACYDYEPRPLEVQQQLFREKQQSRHHMLVAVDMHDCVVGFATYGLFRPRAGWRFACEHSLYVDGTQRGKGIGRLMLPAIQACARQRGFHTMVGVVDAANQASLNLHRQFGFELVGVMKEGGFKFDRWLDVAFIQARL